MREATRHRGPPALWLALLVLFLGPWGCETKEPVESDAAVLLGPENIVQVERRSISTGPLLSGSLEPRQQAALAAEVSGSVTQVGVEVGERVEQDQVLARIEASAIQETYRAAQERVQSAQRSLRLAQTTLEATRRLFEAGAVAEQQLDQDQDRAASAQAALVAARADRAQASERVHNAVIRAPFEGVVSQQRVHEGDVVAPGTPLFTIIDPSSMRLEATAPSDALHSLKVGMPVEFSVRGLPDRNFSGNITQIAPAADPVTRQLSLLVSIPNASGELLAGLFAEGRVGAETHEGLVLPVSAVSFDSEKRPPQQGTVWVVRDNELQRIEVELGLLDEKHELVEITEGLGQGERVVVNGTTRLKEGTPVELIGERDRREARVESEASGGLVQPRSVGDNGSGDVDQ